MKLLSRVWLLATPWTAAYQAGSSIHGIFQARVLEWGAIAFSGWRFYDMIKKRTKEWMWFGTYDSQLFLLFMFHLILKVNSEMSVTSPFYRYENWYENRYEKQG